MNEEMVLEQRQFQGPRNEFGSILAMYLTVHRKQHGHIVLEEFAPNRVPGFLGTSTLYTSAKDIAGYLEVSKLAISSFLREMRVDILAVIFLKSSL